MSSVVQIGSGKEEFVHPDALGVRRFAGSRFVTETSSGALSVTRVLRWEGEKSWSVEISKLPRGRPRPTVYCPFCGRVGQYALTDNYCYFRHGDGEQDCVSTALEHARHRRGKACLLKGLRRAREEGRSVQWTRTCRVCRKQTSETILLADGWTSEGEEVHLRAPDGGSLRSDVVALTGTVAVLALEVRFRHPVEPETLAQFEALRLPMLELAARYLIDDAGNERWDGTGPLPAPVCWRVPGIESPFRCELCLQLAAAPAVADAVVDVLREVAKAARRDPLCIGVRCARCAGVGTIPLLPRISKEEMRRDGSRAVIFAPAAGPALRVSVGGQGAEPEEPPRALLFDEEVLRVHAERLPELPRPQGATGIPELSTYHFCGSCRAPSMAAQDIDELWRRLGPRRPDLLEAVRREVEMAAGLASGALVGKKAGWATQVEAEPESFLGEPAMMPVVLRGLRGLRTGVALLASAFNLDASLLQQLGDTLIDVLLYPHRALARRLSDGEPVADGLLLFADDVQRRLGLDGDDWRRAAWTAEALVDWSDTGNTAAHADKIAGHVFKRVKSAYGKGRFHDRSHTAEWVAEALRLGVAVRRENGMVMLTCVDEAERAIAAAVVDRSVRPPRRPERLVSSTSLHPRQEEAAWCALGNRLSIITGGAGTGKTTILRTVIASSPRDAWLVAAPTGKAMNRAREALTGLPNVVGFRTIAKLLAQLEESSASSDLPNFGSLALDEVSFLDTELAGRLLPALAKKQRGRDRLVLVGDPNQLPSIQAGAVLRDLLAVGRAGSAPAVPQVRLLHPYRSLGPITQFAYSILEGRPRLDLVEVIDAEDDASVLARVEEVVDAAATGDVQVLAPRRDLVVRLNSTLRKLFNPAGVEYRDRLFDGDRVVCCRNRYEEPAILNGEVGTLKVGAQRATGDRPFSIHDRSNVSRGPFSETDAEFFEPAYALTIHKAQGSEWPTVVVAVPPGARNVDRAMLYTAATRAQARLVLVGSRAAILDASARTRPRVTDLTSCVGRGLALAHRASRRHNGPADQRSGEGAAP